MLGADVQKEVVNSRPDWEVPKVNGKGALPIRRSVPTASGQISYMEQGSGPVALFVHGVLLNGYLWRHQLAGLSDIRRCMAIDLLAHGDTEIAVDQDVVCDRQCKDAQAISRRLAHRSGGPGRQR